MEKQMWRNRGDLTRWKITDWKKTKDAIQLSSTRTNRRDGKMFRKIVDWASTESGKEVLTGVICGIVGIIAVRLLCFLVCLATGYHTNVWNIFG